MNQNRRIKKRFIDKLYSLFVALIIIAGFFAIGQYLGKVVVRASQVPTVYMIHGDKDTCRDAIDAQGNPTTCKEAMKDGRFNRVWVAPKTLNEN